MTKNLDWANIGFGYRKTDYRYVSNFKNGNVICPYEPRLLNIGYMGEGIFKSKDNEGKRTKEYDLSI